MNARAVSIQTAAGFTLIEVIAAMAIMVFLFAGIYSVSSGALTLCRASQETRQADLRLSNLDAFFRRAFERAPGLAEFELRGSSHDSILILRQAPGMLTWSGASSLNAAAFLYTEPDPRQQGALRLMLEQGEQGAKGERLPLLTNLISLKWRCLPVDGADWQSNWTPQKGRPLMAELLLRMKDDPGEQRFVFFIPPLNRSIQEFKKDPVSE